LKILSKEDSQYWIFSKKNLNSVIIKAFSTGPFLEQGFGTGFLGSRDDGADIGTDRMVIRGQT
jgi:hypothetical protein